MAILAVDAAGSAAGALTGDPFLDIRLGRVKGMSMFAVNGTNTALPTGSSQVDISTQGGIFLPPSAGVTVEIVSDDAADTLAGTGTQVVSFVYLDTNRVRQTEIILMNGTTPVTLTATPLRPISITGIVTGSSNEQAGKVTLREPGGQTWLESGQCADGKGRNFSFSGFYSPPAGITAYTVNVATTTAKNDEVQFEPWLILADGTEISGQPFSLFEGSLDRRLRNPFAITGDVDVAFRGRSKTGGAADVSIIVDILEVQNDI